MLYVNIDSSHPKIASQSLKEMVLEFWNEVHLILPELPEGLEVTINNERLIQDTGVGGFVSGNGKVVLSFDPNFPDKPLQRHNLRGTIFHQAYHMIQGHSFANPVAEYDTALDYAIYEGTAIVFEQKYADSYPAWGDYHQVPTSILDEWRTELSNIPIYRYLAKDEIWQEWSSATNNPRDSWRSYKVGTRLVNDYLKATGKNILDLKTLSAEYIRITS